MVGEVNLDSADIQSFRDSFGITALGPHGSVQMENPPASVCAAPDPSDNEPEGYLDAEWSGAMAPDATVDFVACGRQGVTSGADLAAAYIIQDPAHVKRISVLSTSYGDCEAQPQSEANQFYVSLWQQAAAEGITVVVASGDTGGDGCQYVGAYATDGTRWSTKPHALQHCRRGNRFQRCLQRNHQHLLVRGQRPQFRERAIVYSGNDVERRLRQPPGSGLILARASIAAPDPTDSVPGRRNSRTIPRLFPLRECLGGERRTEHGVGPASRADWRPRDSAAGRAGGSGYLHVCLRLARPGPRH